LTVRLTEAAKDVGARSSGRLNITVFSNSQLGGDPEMLSQLRAGGIELLAAPSMTLSTLVPLSGLPSVGFAFQSYDQVWAGRRGGPRLPSPRPASYRCRKCGTTASGRSPLRQAGS
jgi:TRAP-type C4-dicarboxylate transport system substrate-binding protein